MAKKIVENDMFEFMKTLTLRARYECLEAGTLPPYLGSTIRGIMGHCIREFYCQHRDKKCFLCENRTSCVYVQCFSNTGGEAGAVNSYTIYVQGQGKEKWEQGDYCEFDLTLFGKGTEQAGVYLDALLAAQRKGWGSARLQFRLTQIMDPDSQKLIYAGGKSWMRNLNPRPLLTKERNATSACLIFDTPLRMLIGGEPFQTLSFEVLIQFLTRRMSLLIMKYTDLCLEWDIEEILHKAAKINTVDEFWKEVAFSRYSMNSRNGKLELPARTGWVLYEGDLSCFVPILEAGRHLRLGKGTTIGFGHYDIFYDR